MRNGVQKLHPEQEASERAREEEEEARARVLARLQELSRGESIFAHSLAPRGARAAIAHTVRPLSSVALRETIEPANICG